MRNTVFTRAFTLLELLVVITILGILAALSVPAIKNLGKSNVQVGGAQQMLDDVAQARRLAISKHTTVYMVFVPQENNWWGYLQPSQLSAGTNLLDKQCSGYVFLSMRSVGDQPGRGEPQYISEWKSLPEGVFIDTNKFDPTDYSSSYYPIHDYSSGVTYPVYAFPYALNTFRFPTETNTPLPGLSLPYIAFNYRGQLTVDGNDIAQTDEYIPLAQGSVLYYRDANKALVPGPASFEEKPPGNSTNSMYNIVHIDRLTGRAELLTQQVQ